MADFGSSSLLSSSPRLSKSGAVRFECSGLLPIAASLNSILLLENSNKFYTRSMQFAEYYLI